MNFEKKNNIGYKEVTKNSDASSKNLKSGSKKINYDAVETSSKNHRVSRKSLMRSTSDYMSKGVVKHIYVLLIFLQKLFKKRLKSPNFRFFCFSF